MGMPTSEVRTLFARGFRRQAPTRLIAVAALTLIVFGLVFRPVFVRGHSMEPTLADGSLRVATRWWLDSQRHPARGDVAIIRRAGARVFYLKRILALPKETIAFSEGRLFINGMELPEPYRSTESNWNMPPVTLGVDEYFVAGDNRGMPMQEHAAGKVNRQHFAGRLWP